MFNLKHLQHNETLRCDVCCRFIPKCSRKLMRSFKSKFYRLFCFIDATIVIIQIYKEKITNERLPSNDLRPSFCLFSLLLHRYNFNNSYPKVAWFFNQLGVFENNAAYPKRSEILNTLLLNFDSKVAYDFLEFLITVERRLKQLL